MKCESEIATRPLLFSDTLSGAQVGRDDLWAVTTEELNALQAVVDAALTLQQLWIATGVGLGACELNLHQAIALLPGVKE